MFPLALGSYLLGAIPFGWLLAKLLRGIDLRQFGSGSTGATNAGRAVGKWAALAVYLLDFGKGFLPTWLWLRGLLGNSTEDFEGAAILGAAAILGHCFPVYLGFRGGKGVATTTGVLFAMDPMAMGLSGGIWVVSAVLTRYVSVASMLLALSLPGFVYFIDPAKATGSKWPVLLLALLVAVFILFTHRENLRRLAAGTEPRIGAKS